MPDIGDLPAASLTALAADLAGAAGLNAVYYPSRAMVLAVEPETAHTGFTTFVGSSPASWFEAQRSSTGTQNDYVEWTVQLRPGTYTVVLFHLRQSDRGIYTLSINGSNHGTTVDGYNAGNSVTRTALTGVTIPGGDVAVRLTMATKNASSSAYKGAVDAVAFVRTGA